MFASQAHSCRRRLTAAVVCVVVGLAVGCGPVSTTPPSGASASTSSNSYRGPTEDRWRAKSLIMLRSVAPEVLHDEQKPQAPYDQYVRTQLELIKSPIVMDRVAADPELAKMAEVRERSGLAIEWLLQHTDVYQVNQSEIFAITFDALNAMDAAKVTNMITDSYIKIASDLDANRDQQIVDLLDKEMDRRTRELERLRQSVRALVKMTRGNDYVPGEDISGAVQLPVADQPLVQLKKSLAQTQRDRMALESRAEVLGKKLENSETVVDAAEIDQMIDDDIEMVDLRKDLAAAQQELQAADAVKAELPNSVAAGARERVAALEQKIAARRENLESRIVRNQEQSHRQRRESMLGDMLLDIETKRHLEAQLTSDIDAATKEIEKQNNHALDLEFLRQDLVRSERIFAEIADRAELLKTNMRSPERVGELRRANAAEVVKVRVPRWKS